MQVEKLRQEKLRLAAELRQKKAALKAKGAQKPGAGGSANGSGASAAGGGVQVLNSAAPAMFAYRSLVIGTNGSDKLLKFRHAELAEGLTLDCLDCRASSIAASGRRSRADAVEFCGRSCFRLAQR